MRKLVVLSFITLDGVMQAPGGPQEDPTGGFKYGGWVFPYFDEMAGKVMDKQMGHPFDLLLGRKTYEIFAAHWPYQKDSKIADRLNDAKKYVVSKTLKKLDWENTTLISDNVPQEIKQLKEQQGPDLHMHGSGNLIQTLLKNDLVDELWLKIFPITLGKGKRLFEAGAIPVAFTLSESVVTPSGVIVASYVRSGNVKTGTFADDNPSEAELKRRKKIMGSDS
jgi:dihydrofolate reductase